MAAVRSCERADRPDWARESVNVLEMSFRRLPEISRKVLSGCGVRFGDERTGGSWLYQRSSSLDFVKGKVEIYEMSLTAYLKHSEGSLKVVLGFGVRFVLKVKELCGGRGGCTRGQASYRVGGDVLSLKGLPETFRRLVEGGVGVRPSF